MTAETTNPTVEWNDYPGQRIAQLEAEVKRLRWALERICDAIHVALNRSAE